MQETETCGRHYRWGNPSRAEVAERHPREWQSSPAQVAIEEWTGDLKRSHDAKILADVVRQTVQALWTQLGAKGAVHSEVALLRARSEQLRKEFEILAEQWRQDTLHLSQISKKVAHPAYFRIMGMGEAVVPLLLEALRDKPSHWFAALQATANVNPVADGANPVQAREAWLRWGKSNGLVD